MQRSPPEALLVCPLCSQAVATAAYDDHLRRAHRLFSYRNVRRSAQDTVEAILPDLITTRPSDDAWQALARLARDEHGDRAEQALAELFATALAALPDARRETITIILAPLVAQPRLVAALAERREPAARSLGLACVAYLPVTPDALRSLNALLLDRRLSGERQIYALARLWPRLSGDAQAQLVDGLTEGLSRARAINALRELEKQVGQHPAITAPLEELQENAKLACPRCGVEMRRAAMEQHLWNEHRLILDGLKTRDPWSLVEDWLDECRAAHQPELLARCHIAAAKIDPDGGPLRLARMSLSRGLADPESRRLLLELAREKQSACCPWCSGMVPVPGEVPIPHVNLRPGRLSSRGYEARTDDRGLRTWLEVRTPAGPVYQGYEPGRSWTIRGISALAAAPLVLLALAFACLWPARLGLPFRAVASFVGLAALAFTSVRLFGMLKRPTPTPVLRYTWRYLIPRLYARGFDADDAAFVAGLARLHTRVGLAGVDANQLGRLARLTEQAAAKDPVAAGCLADLCRLRVEKEVERGNDPVPLVAGLVARAFEGQLPLVFAQRLLEDWATKWWTPINLARLRVLLCDRAFEAGFEVQSLLDAGQNAPALGTVLGTAEPRTLAALRLLWSLRAMRPWDKLGDVRTAFELAADIDRAGPLGEQADLLLYLRDPSCQVVAEGPGRMGPATIRLTTLGVWLQEVLFRIPPREVEVRVRSSGGQLILGPDSFRSPKDLEPLSRDLERWFRYAFHEFLPGVDRVLSWRSPDRAAILRAWGAVPCPECGRHLLPRAGEVGIALDERA